MPSLVSPFVKGDTGDLLPQILSPLEGEIRVRGISYPLKADKVISHNLP